MWRSRPEVHVLDGFNRSRHRHSKLSATSQRRGLRSLSDKSLRRCKINSSAKAAYAPDAANCILISQSGSFDIKTALEDSWRRRWASNHLKAWRVCVRRAEQRDEAALSSKHAQTTSPWTDRPHWMLKAQFTANILQFGWLKLPCKVSVELGHKQYLIEICTTNRQNTSLVLLEEIVTEIN